MHLCTNEALEHLNPPLPPETSLFRKNNGLMAIQFEIERFSELSGGHIFFFDI